MLYSLAAVTTFQKRETSKAEIISNRFHAILCKYYTFSLFIGTLKASNRAISSEIESQ